jgi:lipid II:glycine glycyltransferase (peptidoglycan interpeptide bridge formation enzyme)
MTSLISFEQIDIDNYPHEEMNKIGNVNIFQTIPWLKFVSETHKGEPIVLAIKSDGFLEGYFTGLIVKKFGINILGSPFRGWQSYFLGFNLMSTASYLDILRELRQYTFQKLGCTYMEIIDPSFEYDGLETLPYKVEHLDWYAVDLNQSEDDILANMKHSGRNCIRKAIKSGVVIEEVTDNGFASEYFSQYKDVLARHEISPAYSLEMVEKMIDTMLPTGNMVLLKALNPERTCIATGIFLALNKTAVFWGAASWRQYQSLRPNDLLAWEGIKIMKQRGIQKLHLGGQSEQFKEKLGCQEANLYRLMKAKYITMDLMIGLMNSTKSQKLRNLFLRQL